MFTDLILCKDYFSDLGFDSVLTVNPVEFTNKFNLKKKLQGEQGLKIVLGSKNNRLAVEVKQINILLSPEKGVRKDSLHQRHSGLNQVICKLAKKNDIAIGFNFNEILTNKGWKRAEILGRMMQNVKLCRKYKIMMVLGSFAFSKWDMRAVNDLISFGMVIGMHPAEARDSLKSVNIILKKRKEKKFIVSEGIKLVE